MIAIKPSSRRTHNSLLHNNDWMQPSIPNSGLSEPAPVSFRLKRIAVQQAYGRCLHCGIELAGASLSSKKHLQAWESPLSPIFHIVSL